MQMLRYEAWTAEMREANDEISEIKGMLLPLPRQHFRFKPAWHVTCRQIRYRRGTRINIIK